MIAGIALIALTLAFVAAILWQFVRGFLGHEMRLGLYLWAWRRTRNPLLFWVGAALYLALALTFLALAVHVAGLLARGAIPWPPW